ncbi:uncharacterized protein N7473_005357 [Penicillium subrubescens]|uniref:uncharacterized protein n=1 Tax=Penicillium subrubescens TaxID=1316194 RepID=UPI0025454DAF|nr:uncharacterized protein N7473_005357 [Penicillium subrubescens]KAJ5895958.1 hypothetical protein N7473_005357 [Penicillium subrubescens]
MDNNTVSANTQCKAEPTKSSQPATPANITRGRDYREIKELVQPERRDDGIQLKPPTQSRTVRGSY